MFDLLATIGVAAIGEIIKQSVGAAVNWAKGRKKPPTEAVHQKIEQIVTDATKQVAPAGLSVDDRDRVVSGLIDVVRPTLDQVMKYSPNTQRIVSAARKVSPTKAAAKKKAAPRKAATKKVAVKKASPQHAATKKAGARKGAAKRKR